MYVSSSRLLRARTPSSSRVRLSQPPGRTTEMHSGTSACSRLRMPSARCRAASSKPPGFCGPRGAESCAKHRTRSPASISGRWPATSQRCPAGGGLPRRAVAQGDQVHLKPGRVAPRYALHRIERRGRQPAGRLDRHRLDANRLGLVPGVAAQVVGPEQRPPAMVPRRRPCPPPPPAPPSCPTRTATTRVVCAVSSFCEASGHRLSLGELRRAVSADPHRRRHSDATRRSRRC